MGNGKKLLLIVNPKAGTQGATKGIFNMADVFCAAGFDLSLRITQCRNDACETVKAVGENYDYIVCSGGDGTLNEVVSGALTLDTQPLIGYIPSGSTNDFATNLGLVKNDFRGGAKRIVEGKASSVDVGLIGDRHFCYTASFGAFTAVTYSTPQNIKNVLGRFAYFLEAVKDIASIREYKVKVTDKEGNTRAGEYIFGFIANTLSMGGILDLEGLNVSLNDGKFECLLIKTPENAIALNEIITALVTNNFECPHFDILKSSEFTVEFNENVDWTIDGEYGAFGERVNILALPKAINIVV